MERQALNIYHIYILTNVNDYILVFKVKVKLITHTENKLEF